MNKVKRASWVVRMKCVVIKEVICDDCTEEQARTRPFDFASDEQEIGQDDWEVTAITENK